LLHYLGWIEIRDEYDKSSQSTFHKAKLTDKALNFVKEQVQDRPELVLRKIESYTTFNPFLQPASNELSESDITYFSLFPLEKWPSLLEKTAFPEKRREDFQKLIDKFHAEKEEWPNILSTSQPEISRMLAEYYRQLRAKEKQVPPCSHCEEEKQKSWFRKLFDIFG
jgi:hypothetical protein